jgi:hypothetical protein
VVAAKRERSILEKKEKRTEVREKETYTLGLAALDFVGSEKRSSGGGARFACDAAVAESESVESERPDASE